MIQEETASLVEQLDGVAASGKSVQMLDVLSQYTLRIMLRVFFGGVLDRDVKRIRVILEAHADLFVKKLLLPSWLVSEPASFRKAHDEFLALARAEVKAALAEHRGIAGQVSCSLICGLY